MYLAGRTVTAPRLRTIRTTWDAAYNLPDQLDRVMTITAWNVWDEPLTSVDPNGRQHS